MAVFVLMGVSGTGKSTVGCRVAEELSLTFIEADDFHPQHNVQKMTGGTPLTDEDRGPWVEALVSRDQCTSATAGRARCVLRADQSSFAIDCAQTWRSHCSSFC